MKDFCDSCDVLDDCCESCLRCQDCCECEDGVAWGADELGEEEDADRA
jgi:hypothetical protein